MWLVDIFRAKIVDISEHSLTIEVNFVRFFFYSYSCVLQFHFLWLWLSFNVIILGHIGSNTYLSQYISSLPRHTKTYSSDLCGKKIIAVCDITRKLLVLVGGCIMKLLFLSVFLFSLKKARYNCFNPDWSIKSTSFSIIYFFFSFLDFQHVCPLPPLPAEWTWEY